jgi:hypothetical protein
MKKYLPISTKNLIIEQIINSCIAEENGMKYCDYLLKETAINLSIYQFYGENELETVDYDQLAETGKFEEVKAGIPHDELTSLFTAIDNMIEQKLTIENSLAGVVNRNFTNLIAKIPDEKGMQKIIKALPKAIDKISPENLELIKGLIDKKVS